MNILGISAGSESGVCWFQDGELRLAASEERFSRTKFDAGFPALALDWILRDSRLDAGQIDLICYGFSQEPCALADEPALIEKLLRQEAGQSQAAKNLIRQRIETELQIDRQKRDDFFTEVRRHFPNTSIYQCNHHQAHQAAAFAPSPFDDALVVSADGRGDLKSLSIGRADRRTGITELYSSPSWRSLGYFYGRITHLCGFTANRHEGKVTGLAAHGNPQAAQSWIRRMLDFQNGMIQPDFGDLYTPFFSNYSSQLLEQASAFTREDLAAAAQQQLEHILCRLIREHAQRHGLRRVCLAGGVFGNVKLNQRIRELDCIDEVFVYPAMSDGGICAGGVYHYLLTGNQRVAPLSHVYLGPECTLPETADGDNDDLLYYRDADPLQHLLDLLDQGKAIGLLTGRSEFGPRALGHRSIIASAFDSAITERINRMLHRDDFMPFAPAIAEELAGRCLNNYSPSCISAQFMTLCFPVSDEFAANSPAAVHIDGTVRPQIVTAQSNPFFHALLLAWHAKTGGLCLLNTSFNVHEEPIVNSWDDAIRALRQQAVDVLFSSADLFVRNKPASP